MAEQLMQAVLAQRYGSPDVLRLDHVTQPTPPPDELLVRIAACSVNPGDWDVLHGQPVLLRPVLGLRGPRDPVLGLAVAGTVEMAGAEATGFERGDRVMAGIRAGGFAEFAIVPLRAAAPIPSRLDFVEAAAIPVAGTTALQALRDVARVVPGHHVLVTGASGGIGSFAVQIAKTMGAEVTGVCGPANLDLVSDLGADHVVDYSRDDFLAGGARYDVILDNVGNRSLRELLRSLRPGGILIPNSNKGGGRWVGRYLRRAIGALAITAFVPQRLRPFASTERAEDLAALAALVEDGRLRPVVDRTFPLADTAKALASYGEGHTAGKVVVTVAPV